MPKTYSSENLSPEMYRKHIQELVRYEVQTKLGFNGGQFCDMAQNEKFITWYYTGEKGGMEGKFLDAFKTINDDELDEKKIYEVADRIVKILKPE